MDTPASVATSVKLGDLSEGFLEDRPGLGRGAAFQILPYVAKAHLLSVSCIYSIERVVVLHRW
jgi:hypothetical protein